MTRNHQAYIPILAPILFAVLVGCDGVPQLAKVDKLPVAENVVASFGRGGYDWFYTGGKFEVIAPSELEVFEKLDRDRVVASFPNMTFEERREPFRPDGMDDSVYVTFSRYCEPYFDTEPFLSIPFSPTINGMFCIDADGKRLALLTEHLEIWDLVESRIIERHLRPSESCKQVAWSFDPDELIVRDRSTIYVVSASTGQTLRSWQPPEADAPAFFACAVKSPATVVSTAKGRLYLLDQELQIDVKYAGTPITNPIVAIRPNANCVLAQVNSDIVRWNLGGSIRGRVDKLAALEHKQPFNDQLIAGHSTDYILEPYEYASLPPSEQIVIRQVGSNFLAHATCLGILDENNEWLTSCLSRPNENGKSDYFVQDIHLGDAVYSLEFPIGSEPVLEMRTNLATEVCVVRDARELRVYHRKRWKDALGGWTIGRLGQLAVDGEFEQLELVASELRKMPRTRVEYGESLYANIAQQIGFRWARLELEIAKAKVAERETVHAETEQTGTTSDPSTSLDGFRSSLVAFDNWKAKGSELAMVASAYRHRAIGLEARGTGYANSVTPENWIEFSKRTELTKADVRALLRSQKPSCAALRTGIEAGLRSDQSIHDQQQLHKRFLENYPFDVGLHTDVCLHLLPRWGGSPGEAGAYLNSVADLLPQPLADIIYVRTALRFYRTYDTAVFESGDGGLSSSRLMRGIGTLIDLNELGARDTETFIQIALRFNRPDLATKVAQYHVQRFTLSEFEPRSAELALLKSARRAMYNE